ncbi:MAG: hypothetical protein FVQ77_04730 [Cytophagales bacterium]|nr:hypothetical protein [Cytophagales bacterium]
MTPPSKALLLLTIFCIAMGFFEAAVVVYLRELYYPEGFQFPIKIMTPNVFVVELIREISTIVMLCIIGIICGKNFYERLAYFIYCFAVWDILYYVGLKVFLDWPPSLLTWDILFLIPIVWVGPVLAPVICSVTMILLAGCIISAEPHHLARQNAENKTQKDYTVKINLTEWVLLFSGSLIILFTFMWDYTKLLIKEGFTTNFQQAVAQYVPTDYNWYLFAVGEILLLFAIALFWRRTIFLKNKIESTLISPKNKNATKTPKH